MHGEHLYRVDENGYPLKEDVIIVYFDEDNNLLTEVDEDVIKVVIPQGLLRPRWTGEEWVEDMTQEEIDELNRPRDKEPSFEEVQLEYNIDLDYRLSLLEMGLI